MTNDNTITRRQAIKRIGLGLAGAVLASTGISSLTSCARAEKRRRVVLYFTATGNSLYIARELAGADGEVISIPQLMRTNNLSVEADEIGIVYPIYGLLPPNMVRNFINGAKLRADYLFTVMTYGNYHGNAAENWNEIASTAGYRFNYINSIVMVDNWLPAFDMNEQIKIDKHIPENLKTISADINSRRNYIQPTTEEERETFKRFLAFSALNPEVGFFGESQKYFTTTDACIGCGVCTQVCPRDNYSLNGKTVAIEGECEVCLACIHNCPQRAIVFKEGIEEPMLSNGEKNPSARYRNENVSLADIKRANNQF